MNNKVSIIVPIYNQEKYLARCIDSILCQTYDNIEVLLINDGSTDTSAEICKKYASSNSKI
jgi:glycosyltransferase involved in cell wall biosynthesis